MAHTPDAREFQSRLQRLEVLLQEVERFADPSAQAHTREIVQAVLDLHGTGLERIIHHLENAGPAGAVTLDTCARDDIVAGLLLLHGLHPQDLETRVLQALEQVRPALRAHGGNVELIGVDEGVVRLRLVGSCNGCPSSAVTMKTTIEEAILARAPDVAAVKVENATPPPAAVTHDGRTLIPLTVL